MRVPVARDGSMFLPDLRRAGGFTVGPKGHERRIESYEEAIAYLQDQPSASWRRPNASGNWGIVTAVRWMEVT